MYKTTAQTNYDNPHREAVLEFMKKAGATRIAIAYPRILKYRFSSEESFAELEKSRRFFEDNDIETLVWLGESIGHSGARTDKKDIYRHMKYNTKGEIEAFCPLDENFVHDYCEWTKKVARCGFKMIMIDDDFRLGYRGGLGCCCDVHMKAMCDEIGEYLTVDELHERVLSGGRNKYRDAWLKVQGESMYSFAKSLRRAVDEVDKNIRLSFCSSPNIWDTDGVDAEKMARVMAGDTKPFIRLIGAPYWGKLWPNQRIGEVIEYERMEMSWLKGKGIEMFSEGDTYPRPRFSTPAAFLECFDQVLRADSVSDGILKYMFEYPNDPAYEPEYVLAAERNSEIYREIERIFADKEAVGVYPYVKQHILRDTEFEGESKSRINDLQEALFAAAARFAVRNSLPTAYSGDGVKILFGEHARHIEKDELASGCIIDITAAKILEKRGIDTGLSDTCSAGMFNREFFKGENRKVNLRDEFMIYNTEVHSGAEYLTEYVNADKRVNGIYRYENKEGQRFMTIPLDAESQKLRRGLFESYALRRLVTENLEWLGGKKPDAVLCGNYPHMYFMTKKKENTLAVGMWNLFEDKAHSVSIEISGKIRDVRFINCSGHTEDGRIVLDTPVYPFEFAAVEAVTQ